MDVMTVNNAYPLTKEQREIAETPPDRSVIVLAPPGTGKTHTVVARIDYLIERFGLH
jgi:superfamily I DNA/RNA helicase